MSKELRPTCASPGCANPRDRFTVLCKHHLLISLGFDPTPATPEQMGEQARLDGAERVRRSLKYLAMGAISADEMDSGLYDQFVQWLTRGDDNGSDRLAGAICELSVHQSERLLALIQNQKGSPRLFHPLPPPGEKLDAMRREADRASDVISERLRRRVSLSPK